jgi:hypothetical protein
MRSAIRARANAPAQPPNPTVLANRPAQPIPRNRRAQPLPRMPPNQTHFVIRRSDQLRFLEMFNSLMIRHFQIFPISPFRCTGQFTFYGQIKYHYGSWNAQLIQ